MTERNVDNLYHLSKLTEVYEATSGWAEDSDYYLSLASDGRLDILDLGCGTGLLCDAYAALGHSVVGVDPASEMLERAKRKPHGQSVTWVVSSGQEFSSDRKFDLIVMTGHAFQCLLSDAETLALLRNVRTLLKDQGTFCFESRNPNIDWPLEWDGAVEDVESAHGDFRMYTRVLNATAELLTFEHQYVFADSTLESVSTIRFPTRTKLEDLMASAGLNVLNLVGDWDRSPFVEDASREMIFRVSAASPAAKPSRA